MAVSLEPVGIKPARIQIDPVTSDRLTVTVASAEPQQGAYQLKCSLPPMTGQDRTKRSRSLLLKRNDLPKKNLTKTEKELEPLLIITQGQRKIKTIIIVSCYPIMMERSRKEGRGSECGGGGEGGFFRWLSLLPPLPQCKR